MTVTGQPCMAAVASLMNGRTTHNLQHSTESVK